MAHGTRCPTFDLGAKLGPHLRVVRQGVQQARVLAEAAARGLQVASGSCSEIYKEDAFPEAMRPAGGLPVARELGETSLAFLVDPTKTRANVEKNCEGPAALMGEAAG